MAILVPDGVATVTLRYRARHIGGLGRRILPALTVTGHAVNNAVVVSVPRTSAQAQTIQSMTWRAANGSIIKTFSRL